MSQQKPRRIGMGMKPRSPEESGSVNENLPATEGQETVSLQGPNEVADVAVEGGGLESVVAELFPAAAESESEVETGEPEAKTGEVSDVASNAVSDPLNDLLKSSFPEQMRDAEKIPAALDQLQNLESPPDSISDAPMWFNAARASAAADDEDGDHIERFFNDGVMARRAGLPPIPGNSQEWTPKQAQSWRSGWADEDQSIASVPALAEKMLPEMGLPEITPAGGGEKPQYFIGTDFGSGPDKTVVAVIEKGTSEAPDKLVGIFDIKLGEMDSGEYRHTVRIAEAYVEGAKQQAEADNMDLESWLSLQLNTYLEQWWFAAGPKS